MNVSLVDLGPHACRWPTGEATGAAQLFCGVRADEGKPYCAHHHQRAYPPQNLPGRRLQAMARVV